MNYNENSFMYAVHLFGGSVFRLFWDPILFSLYVVFAPGSPVGGSASAENRVMRTDNLTPVIKTVIYLIF